MSEGFHEAYVTSGALRAWYPLEEGTGRVARVWWEAERVWGDANISGEVLWEEDLDEDAGERARPADGGRFGPAL